MKEDTNIADKWFNKLYDDISYTIRVLLQRIGESPVISAIILFFCLFAIFGILILIVVHIFDIDYENFQLLLILNFIIVIIGDLFIVKWGTSTRKDVEKTLSIQTINKKSGTSMNYYSLLSELDEKRKENILRAFKDITLDLSDELQLPPETFRCNIFALDNNDGLLRIVPHLHYNMNISDELTIDMRPGEGSTGRAYIRKNVNIALYKNWGRSVLDDERMKKVHPNLRWIISIPILAVEENLSKSGYKNIEDLIEKYRESETIAILNIDGIENESNEESLALQMEYLSFWALLITQNITEFVKTSIE